MSQTASSLNPSQYCQHLPINHFPIPRYYGLPDKADRGACARFRLQRKAFRPQRFKPNTDGTSQSVVCLEKTVNTLHGQVAEIAKVVDGLVSAVREIVKTFAMAQATAVQCLSARAPPSFQPAMSDTDPSTSGYSAVPEDDYPASHLPSSDSAQPKHDVSGSTSSLSDSSSAITHTSPVASSALEHTYTPAPISTASALPALRGRFSKCSDKHEHSSIPLPSRRPKKGISASLPGLRGRLL